MIMTDTNVCTRLGEERKRLSLNQQKVAEFCGVSVKTIGRWEKNIPIPADKLALLTELGYDITYIITNTKLSPQSQGLEAASTIWEKTDKNKSPISSEQQTWLSILDSLSGGDSERLRQIGLAIVGYSQTNKKT